MRLTVLLSALLLFVAQCGFAQDVPVSQVTREKVKQTVQVSGTVESFRPSRSETAPNSFQLKDASGSIRVAIWPDVFQAISGKEALKDGAKVTVKAKVAEFRNAIELHVDSASDVQIAGVAAGSATTTASSATATAGAGTSAPASDLWGKPAAAGTATQSGVTPISSLTRERMNQEVTIQGKVTSGRRPSSDTAPYILKVADPTGSIDVVFWKDVADKLSDAQKVNVGDQVRVSGKLNEHRGNLQVRVQDASGIQSSKSAPQLFEQSSQTSAPQASLQPQDLPLGKLGQAAPSQLVKVSGQVTALEPIRTGKRVTLKDASGQGLLLLWDTAEGLKPQVHELRPADQLTVIGQVQDAEGTRVVSVTAPENVVSVVR